MSRDLIWPRVHNHDEDMIGVRTFNNVKSVEVLSSNVR